MYSARHDYSMPRTQPEGGGTVERNLNSTQFGKGRRASGTVNTGYNPFTYQGGSHRKMGRLG